MAREKSTEKPLPSRGMITYINVSPSELFLRSNFTGSKPAVKYYLIAYNIISCLGWLLVLLATLSHLLQLSPLPPPSRLARLFNASRTPKPPRWMPASVHPLFKQACTTFAVGRVGPIIRIVQTGALLEVLHVLLGMVRSPLVTTSMQVASRVYLVWGITESFSAVSSFTRTYSECIYSR